MPRPVLRPPGSISNDSDGIRSLSSIEFRSWCARTISYGCSRGFWVCRMAATYLAGMSARWDLRAEQIDEEGRSR